MSDAQIVDLGHTDLANLIYSKVKKLILSKELRPGEKIVQDRLATQLGVSRTPLIKALQMLEAEFLVESIPRRGMFVKEINAKELIDAFECREVLEGVAVRLAAKRITDAEIAKLRALFAPFQGGDGQIDREEYVHADLQFHSLINEISGNQIIARLESLGSIHLMTVNPLTRKPEETLDEHLAIIDALARRDEIDAERLMRQHLRRTRDQIEDDSVSRASD